MAFIHVLKNGYRGKLGETVGQKWKNQMTLRTYNEHNKSKSDAQLEQRSHYKEMISEASLLYPYSRGWPRNAVKNMNSFNHFTSTLEAIRKAGNPAGTLEPINVFNKRGVWSHRAYQGVSGYFLIIMSSPILNDETIKKTKVIAFFATTNGKPQTEFLSETVAGELTKVRIDPDQYGNNGQEAWLLDVRTTAMNLDNLYFVLKIPYRGKIYYSTPSSMPWQHALTEEINFFVEGVPFNIYFS